MELASGTTVDDEALAELCRRHGIRHLALFGSALRDQLGPDSDIDLLVQFERDRVPGLLRPRIHRARLRAVVRTSRRPTHS